MSLPKLPESFPAGYIAKTEHFYTADQMREYGLACRKQALEEAAGLCDNEKWDHQTGAHAAAGAKEET